MNLRELFWPEAEPTAQQMQVSRRLLLWQGALAAVMFNLGTGNFLAGYLGTLGASAAQIAQVTTIPQLGCVLQLVSPLFFERRNHRKASIVALCFLFRFSMGFTVLAPLLFTAKSPRLLFAFTLYSIAFLLAGFVTPALNQWILQIAPQEDRGRYFAAKDVLALVSSSAVSYAMGRWLDHCTAQGDPMRGYLVIYGFCIAGAVVDLVLLALQREPPSSPMPNIRPSNLLAPLREKLYHPVLVYEILGYASTMFSSGFLSVYQLQVLGLSHTFITTVGIVSSLIGMGSIWVWGRVADRTYWTTALLGTRAVSAVCLFAWWLLPVKWAPVLAPVIMGLNAAGNGASSMAGVNLQYDSSPPAGKTAYMGVTAAVASLTGYGAALAGSGVQQLLEPAMGGHSIALLFGISGCLTVITWLYGRARLPRAPVKYPEPTQHRSNI